MKVISIIINTHLIVATSQVWRSFSDEDYPYYWNNSYSNAPS